MSGEVGGAGGSYSYSALKRLDQVWSTICSAQTGGVHAISSVFSYLIVINVCEIGEMLVILTCIL
mgnify:CR=1 FL=1